MGQMVNAQEPKAIATIDDYVLGKLLGSGTTSVVYEGTRAGTDEIYAIKVLKMVKEEERDK